MKLLDIFVEKAGARVDLRTESNADVVTYEAIVRRWTEAGPVPEVTWLPETLETDGNSFVLAAERGYDIVLRATIRIGGHASITPDLRISDGTTYTKVIELPQSEAPVVERVWNFVVK
jgi:hypothetical protein